MPTGPEDRQKERKMSAAGIDLGSWNARVATFDETQNLPVLIHNQDGQRATRVLVDQNETVTAENLQDFYRERLMQLAIDSNNSKDINIVTSINDDDKDEWTAVLREFGGIISESAAVCLAYDDVIDVQDGQRVLVLDGGASGLKATILLNRNGLWVKEYKQSLKEVNGNALVDALGQAVAQQFEQKHRFPRGEVFESRKAKAKLRRACESGLKTLQINNTVTIMVDGLYEGMDCQVSISKPKWEHISSKLARMAKQFLSQLPEVDFVLPSGNMHTWLKPIAKAVFKEKLISSSSIDPSEAVALGCARQAYYSLSEDLPTEPTIEITLSPISIGIKKDNEGDVTIIDQGTPLPCTATQSLEGTATTEIWQLKPTPKQLVTLADLEKDSTLRLQLLAQGTLKIWANGETLVIG